MTDPGRHLELAPVRLVEIALSADLAAAVGDAGVFARALRELGKRAPGDLATDLVAVAELAAGDLRQARQRWGGLRARLADEMLARDPGERRDDAS